MLVSFMIVVESGWCGFVNVLNLLIIFLFFIFIVVSLIMVLYIVDSFVVLMLKIIYVFFLSRWCVVL